ncbi:MAG: TIGR03066 family protein [Gemmataceae bacterium]
MNAMRMLAVAAVVGLLAVGVRAEDKPDTAKLIVGVWEVTKTEEGGPPPGSTIEFTKDGKLKISAKMGDQEFKIDGTYKLEGDKFTIMMKMGEQEHTDTITIKKITKTEMSTTDKDGKVVELKKTK